MENQPTARRSSHEKGLRFADVDALRKWLTSTTAGAEILEEMRQRQTGRLHCLVVLHGDGWVEVYGPRNLQVAMVVRPYALNETGETANLLDEYCELQVPRVYRRLYLPVMLRATGQCEVLTPAEITARDIEAEVMRVCLEIVRKRGTHEQSNKAPKGGRAQDGTPRPAA